MANHPVVVGGRRRVIDFAWPDHGVAVEFDGFEAHSSRRVFDDDRVRQNDLVDEGWRVYRLTATMLDRSATRGVTADRPSAGSAIGSWIRVGGGIQQPFGTTGRRASVGPCQTRSTIMAMPWPPPTHMLSMP